MANDEYQLGMSYRIVTYERRGLQYDEFKRFCGMVDYASRENTQTMHTGGPEWTTYVDVKVFRPLGEAFDYPLASYSSE